MIARRGNPYASLLAFASLVFFAACDDAAAPGDPALYLGTWGVTASKVGLTCPGNSFPFEAELAGDLIVEKGGDGVALNGRFSDPFLQGCVVPMDPRADLALARAGAVCPLSNSAFNGTLTLQTGSMAVMGSTATLTLQGRVAGKVAAFGPALMLNDCQGKVSLTALRRVPGADAGSSDAAAADATVPQAPPVDASASDGMMASPADAGAD